jgi:hypothetical protein
MSPHATLNSRPGALPLVVHASPSTNGDRAASWQGRELVIGRVVDARDEEAVLVEFTQGSEMRSCQALATIPLSAADVGRSVVLAFVAGDLERPIVLGLIAESGAPAATAGILPRPGAAANRVEDAVVLTANREIVLRCGKASLTLTRAGKILMRGAYLLSRSSGVNRIKGASVQIN